MRRAGTVLARRARSEAELARSLAGVAPADVVEGVLDDLRALGYLDDAALGCALAERRLASGWGPLRVRADLERLEIEGDAARAAIAPPRRVSGPPRRACSSSARPRATAVARRRCSRAAGFGEDVHRDAARPRSRLTPSPLRGRRREG